MANWPTLVLIVLYWNGINNGNIQVQFRCRYIYNATSQGVAYIYVYVYGFTLLEQIGTHIRGVERIYWLGREDSSG